MVFVVFVEGGRRPEDCGRRKCRHQVLGPVARRWVWPFTSSKVGLGL